MKITKFGHCCLLIEELGLRILTDPGSYSSGQDEVKGIDIVLISHHEHRDHLHMDSLKAVLKNNPGAKLMTNRNVGAILNKEKMTYVLLEEGQRTSEKGVSIEAFGKKHAVIYPTLPEIHNTGFLIGGRFFYPGDALTIPLSGVEILAFPATGVWVKLSEAIDYVKKIGPKICFPVHDNNLKFPGSIHSVPPKILEPLGIQFVLPPLGKEINF